jgi:hypothetical protein
VDAPAPGGLALDDAEAIITATIGYLGSGQGASRH